MLPIKKLPAFIVWVVPESTQNVLIYVPFWCSATGNMLAKKLVATWAFVKLVVVNVTANGAV